MHTVTQIVSKTDWKLHTLQRAGNSHAVKVIFTFLCHEIHQLRFRNILLSWCVTVSPCSISIFVKKQILHKHKAVILCTLAWGK